MATTLEVGGEEFPIEVVRRFGNGFTFTSVRAPPLPPLAGGIASDGSLRRPVLVRGPVKRPAEEQAPALYEAIFDSG